jgi:hypothetical protein
MTGSQHVYEVRPRKDHRGVDLISDSLPIGRLWYGLSCRVRIALESFLIAEWQNVAASMTSTIPEHVYDSLISKSRIDETTFRSNHN